MKGLPEIHHYECNSCGEEFDWPNIDGCPSCDSTDLEQVRVATDGSGAEVTDATSQKVATIPVTGDKNTIPRRVEVHFDGDRSDALADRADLLASGWVRLQFGSQYAVEYVKKEDIIAMHTHTTDAEEAAMMDGDGE